ncbi:MAG: hypothetical protein KJ624_08135 [Chloroflexi bacterium]|nr:hypothetical protein [Chloroflexota bacterium]
MPKWEIHRKWDSKFGIPPEVSEYVLRAIDSNSLSDNRIPMPEDFRQHTEVRKLPRSRGGNIAIADLKRNLHNRGKDKIIQAEDLEFFSGKGANYVQAYYIHFILDYLNHGTIRYLRKTYGDSVADCIDKYARNKAVLLPETRQHFVCVLDYLKSHGMELQKDLDME